MGFSLKRTFPRHCPYSSCLLFHSTTFAGRLPQPTRLPLARSRSFRLASGTIRPSDYSRSFASHFTSRLIGSLIAMPLRKPHESSWSHAQIFRTVPSANTLVRWVDENAFASIVQARPCPIFGRPVHQRGRPLDYGPVLLLMPFGFHLTVDTLPSGCLATERELRSFPLAVSTVSSCVPV